jgi:pantetheine-phosphate adenylyltransferase
MGIKKAMFPGSFDPFTKGHEAIVRKGLTLFDEVIIAIGVNSNKTSYFTLESRIQQIESLFPEEGVKIITFQGLTVEACEKESCNFILRGLRDTKDFQYERSIAHMNYSLKKIETVFLLTELTFSAINASIVREIYINGGAIGDFVTNAEKLVHKTI